MAAPTLPTEEPATLAPRQRRPVTDVDWRRMLRMGLLAGLGMVFVAATEMLEVLDARILIVPILSLGYVAVGWIPFVMGYLAAKEDAPEGVPKPVKGGRDLLAGLVTGMIGGSALWLLAVVIDAFELREIFRKLSPGLLELLTFGRGLGFGFWALVLGSGVLGLFGGAMAVLPERGRRAVSAALSWTFVVAILELLITDILEDIGLEFLTDWMYDLNGGLNWYAAIAVAVVTGVLSVRLEGVVGKTRARVAARSESGQRSTKVITYAVVAVLAIVIPRFLGGIGNELLANVGLFLLMGLGLNIVVGYAGLLDLGYVAFFAVGAYTTAVLTSPISPRYTPELTVDFLSWEGWAVLAAVLVMAAIAGIVVGTPVIRMRGDYLAIVTLGFGEIVRILFLSDWLAPTFGGAQGVRQIPAAELAPLDLTITGVDPQSIFYFVAVFVAIAIYASWRLSKSRVGRAWAAMREDESVAEAMGIDTVRAKLLAFVTGAMLASFGGMVFAVKVGSVFPKSFELLVSIIVLVVVIVGGMGNIPGVIVGALVLIGVLGGPTQPGVLQEFQQFKLLIYGALLVYMMLQRPEGLVPSASRSRELHHEEMLQDAWLASAIDAEEAEGEGEAS
jgi:branched-chain amino acid transport system permease protein